MDAPVAIAKLDAGLASIWPCKLALDEVRKLLALAVHAQLARKTAEAILTLDHTCVCEESIRLAQSAVDACQSISDYSSSAQDKLGEVFERQGVKACQSQKKTKLAELQHQQLFIRIGRDKIDQAIEIATTNGFYKAHNISGANWECYKRFNKRIDLIKRDDVTTRLRLAWHPNKVYNRIPQFLRPATKSVEPIRLSAKLWWISLLTSPIFSLAKKRSRQDKQTDWPFLGTPMELIPSLLEFANITPSDTLLDIGCGDGRIVLEAAKTYGCKSIGIEKDPDLANLAKKRVESADFQNQVTIISGVATELSYTDVSVVFLFLPVRSITNLIDSLLEKLTPGSRIIVHEQADLPNSLKPSASVPFFCKSGITVAHIWIV
ncbi:Methyltransferase domain family [Verrucomicrobiia bacterium DG1235]|nr:Methyltransferase domain family [Verrucomicrobiae bacterium DG1235]